jgi:asparagine synthase (glutamine-hydrolysing)
VTAFAAVLSLDRDDAGEEAVASVLAQATGTKAQTFSSGACTLLVAPLHPWEPAAPVVDPQAGLAAAGQVMLEGRAGLRGALQLRDDAADLEIVSAARDRWGPERTDWMQGEYAFALWHLRGRTLTCARDGLGIRVLYVGQSGRCTVVSNVLGAVVAHPEIPNELNHAALVRFLAHGRLTTTGATPYKAVRLLPPGHTLTISADGGANLRRHWQPPRVQRFSATDRHSVEQGYREALGASVNDRIAGRPSTLFLSGGIDSTTIAATAVDCAARLRAVTFRYRGIDTDDEVALAAAVADRLAIPLDVVDADADAAMEAERSQLGPATLVDEPGLSNWRAGLAHAAQFSTLAIYGEDGDALFAPPGGGALLAAQSIPSAVAATLRLAASERELPYLGLRLRERLGLSRAASPVPLPWLTPDARHVVEEFEDDTVLGLRPTPMAGNAQESRTWARLLKNVPYDFAVSLSPDVTRQRLAITLPLMDSRVIGYVTSVPPIPWCHRKRLARAAFAEQLPASVLRRRKTPVSGGFDAMVAAWRRRHGSEDAALDEVMSRGWVHQHVLKDALERGSTETAMAAWRVLMLNAWLSRATKERAACIR